MTADVLAAWRAHGWTVYGELGRQPRSTGAKIDSYEHWVGYEIEHGLGFRVGRFLPAYGVRLRGSHGPDTGVRSGSTCTTSSTPSS